MKVIAITLFFLLNVWGLQSQEISYKSIYVQKDLIERIKKGEDWNSLFQFMQTEFNLEEKYLEDIRLTIDFLDNSIPENYIDSLFINICKYHSSVFPYMASGNMKDNIQIEYANDSIKILTYITSIHSGSLHPVIFKLFNKPRTPILSVLKSYLFNDAATRLIGGYLDPLYYYHFSISDMAMEYIEILTQCDFYDNQPGIQGKFSHLDIDSRLQIIDKINLWEKQTKNLSYIESIYYYLDFLCEPGNSYVNTVNNLYDMGDSLNAKKYYQLYHEISKSPCDYNYKVGSKLITLGDSSLLDDCHYIVSNYNCSQEKAINCVRLLYHYDPNKNIDFAFSKLILDELNHLSHFEETNSTQIWHTIFTGLPYYNKQKMPQTLTALMNIKDNYEEFKKIISSGWTTKYKDQIQPDYRICDVALLKFHETVEKIELVDWDDIYSRDIAIEKLIQKYDLKQR